MITLVQKFYMYLSRGIFLKKGSPRAPLQRLLSQKQAHRDLPYGLVFKLKVLGKEFEEKPFSKGFSSTVHIKTSLWVSSLFSVPFIFDINQLIPQILKQFDKSLFCA